MLEKVFDENEKEHMIDQLNKDIEDQLDLLRVDDDDEFTRTNFLFPLIRLRNLFTSNIIDRLEVTQDELDKLCEI